MSHLPIATALLALCLLAASVPIRAGAEAWDADRVQLLVTRLGEATDQGYRLQRTRGGDTGTRLAVGFRRLRIQTRRLSAELDNGRRLEELRPVVLNVQALARDVAEAATEGFASVRFAEVMAELEESANALVVVASQPSQATRQIAFGTDPRSSE